MDAVTLLREQLKAAHELLEATVGEPTPDTLHYVPQGRALPVGAAYAHVIVSEDIVVAGLLQGGTPLWRAGVNTGLSEPMPDFSQGDWEGYADWTHRARIDLPALRSYAQQVYAATDAYLASLSDDDLDHEFEMWGTKYQLGWFISRTLVAHADNLAGEISAAKGLQGLKGYPF